MLKPAPNPLFAAALILLASMIMAAITALAKLLGSDQLGPSLHPFMISLGRFCFALLAVSVIVLGTRTRFHRPDLARHACRSFCGVLGVSGIFAAAAMIPLADATAISFLNPVFAMLLAIPLLGEKVGRYRWLAAVLALGGGLILLRPGAGALELGGVIALGAAVIIGLELIFIKQLSDKEPALQVLFFNNLIGATLITLIATTVWVTPNIKQIGALAAIGFLMVIVQFCFVTALKRADASFIAPFSYATLIFAMIYDGVLFASWPDWISFAGAAPIIAGAMILAWRESRIAPHPSSK